MNLRRTFRKLSNLGRTVSDLDVLSKCSKIIRHWYDSEYLPSQRALLLFEHLYGKYQFIYEVQTSKYDIYYVYLPRR